MIPQEIIDLIESWDINNIRLAISLCENKEALRDYLKINDDDYYNSRETTTATKRRAYWALFDWTQLYWTGNNYPKEYCLRDLL